MSEENLHYLITYSCNTNYQLESTANIPLLDEGAD